MFDRSSCYPNRLIRFDPMAGGLADGLALRSGALTAAVVTYLASCEPRYTTPCDGAATEVLARAAKLRELGRWTGAVGRAFAEADVVAMYIADRNGEQISTVGEAAVLAKLGWGDRWFAAMGRPRSVDVLDPVADDQSGPPEWLRLGPFGVLDVGAESLDLVGRAVGGLAASDLTPDGVPHGWPVRLGARIEGGSKALGVAGVALDSYLTGREQWSRDTDLGEEARLGRMATRVGLVTGLGLAFAAGGGAMGVACGPAAPLCVALGSLAGGAIGAEFGDTLADLLPFMADDDRRPGEFDLEALVDEIEGSGEALDRTLTRSIDLVADTLTEERLAGAPLLAAALAQILRHRRSVPMVNGRPVWARR